MGVPTLNFTIPKEFLFKHGVYAGIVEVEGKDYPAAFHFGPIPAFNERGVVLEAALTGGMLKKTPTMASIELIHYLRDIVGFEGKEALIKAIKGDIEVVKSLLEKP